MDTLALWLGYALMIGSGIVAAVAGLFVASEYVGGRVIQSYGGWKLLVEFVNYQRKASHTPKEGQ